jgi:hydrogenase maturation protease
VLYEGYLLYPYRHTAIKNRQRWTLGVVYPQAYSEADGGVEPWTMQTECLLSGNAQTTLTITVRFLHLLQRSTEVEGEAARGWTSGSWEEGMEREVGVEEMRLHNLCSQPFQFELAFDADCIREDGVVRTQQSVTGVVELEAGPVEQDVYKLGVRIKNTTSLTGLDLSRRDAVLLRSFISTHTIMQVSRGAFLSLLDPPAALEAIARACQNRHTWPVLIGDEGDTDVMLSSPIILYDYPQIAPESLGPLFDGTEIDELLTLRIMTLTDAEKEEMRRGDEQARAILERIESLSPGQLMQLHGTIRSMRPISEGEET